MASYDDTMLEHRLTTAHVAGGMTLSNAAGWNQNEADWRFFLAHGYGVGLSTPVGRLCATTMIMPLGPRFAWISVVLVAEDMRRRGFARRLTGWALDDLAPRGVVPMLDATPAGREVYLQLGFRDCWSLVRVLARNRVATAPVPAMSGLVVRPIEDRDWPRVIAYDAPIFGADRAPVLAEFRSRLPQAALLAERDGALMGYMLGRDGRLSLQFGPVIAESDYVAMALLARALARTTGPVCIDLPERHDVLRDWLAASGFAVGRPFSRMALGTARTFDEGQRLFASAGPEFG